MNKKVTCLDFERLLTLADFDDISKYGIDRSVKSVVIILVDVGPDEKSLISKDCPGYSPSLVEIQS